MSSTQTAADVRTARQYGASVLLTACSRMARGIVPGTLAVLGNAVIQSLLTHLNAPVAASFGFIAGLVLSVVAILGAGAVVTATALESVTGRAALGAVMARVRANLGSYLLWAVALWVVMIAAGMLQPGLATIVALIGAMVPIAAMDGHRNALVAAMLATRAMFGRWLLTSAIVAVGAAVWWLLSAANVFFVSGMLASLIAWLVTGLLLWWLAVAWACMYRSTLVGAPAPPA
jgi:hypothetical protein